MKNLIINLILSSQLKELMEFVDINKVDLSSLYFKWTFLDVIKDSEFDIDNQPIRFTIPKYRFLDLGQDVLYKCKKYVNNREFPSNDDIYPKELSLTCFMIGIFFESSLEMNYYLMRTCFKQINHKDEMGNGIDEYLVNANNQYLSDFYENLLEEKSSNKFIHYYKEFAGKVTPLKFNPYCYNIFGLYDEKFQFLYEFKDGKELTILEKDEKVLIVKEKSQIKELDLKTYKLSKLFNFKAKIFPNSIHEGKYYFETMDDKFNYFDFESKYIQTLRNVEFYFVYKSLLFIFKLSVLGFKLQYYVNQSFLKEILIPNEDKLIDRLFENKPYFKYVVLKDHIMLFIKNNSKIMGFHFTDKSIMILEVFSNLEYKDEGQKIVYLEKINDNLIVTSFDKHLTFWNVKYYENTYQLNLIEICKVKVPTKTNIIKLDYQDITSILYIECKNDKTYAFQFNKIDYFTKIKNYDIFLNFE